MRNEEVVFLTEIVSDVMTNASGFQLFTIIDKNFEAGNRVKLSLSGSGPMTSSFMNSSFGELLDSYGYDFIKDHLSLIDYKPSQAIRIKEYLDDFCHHR